LLLLVPVLLLRLLSMLLLLLVLVLALRLLGMLLLLLVLVLPLLLLGMRLLLSVLLLGFGLLVLTLLLLGVILLFALLLVLCVSRRSDSEKQRQNSCAGDFDCVHIYYLCFFQASALALAQASSCRVHRVADGFAGHKKLHSPVLLPARGAIVGGYWQAVTEASGRN
jgi:hypothetical protein